MRWDMFEVIIERPRGGARREKLGRSKERTERAWERAPGREGMRLHGRSKWLNENLAPLRRFLRKQVGRPWDAVRSELCAGLSMASAVQKHVMDHVKDFVEENPVMIDGTPHHPSAWDGQWRPLRAHPRWPVFYVCPRTGLLREPVWTPRKKEVAG